MAVDSTTSPAAPEPTGRGEHAELAAVAWARLGAVFMMQRSLWLAAAQAEGLTPPQALALMRLRDQAELSLGDVARFLRCDASQMTAFADRLERMGYAERRSSPTDRRVKVLVPTAAGKRAQERLRATYRTPPPELLDLPDEDLVALGRIVGRLLPTIDPDTAALFGLQPGE